jgi:hypothetical protein
MSDQLRKPDFLESWSPDSSLPRTRRYPETSPQFSPTMVVSNFHEADLADHGES